MALSNEARKTLGLLREKYIKDGYPAYRLWPFPRNSDNRIAFQELAAHGYIEPFDFRKWRLTRIGLDVLMNPEPEREAGVSYGQHGEIHVGSKFITNITGSVVGAVAQGDHTSATGAVHLGGAEAITQEQHKAAIKDAQTALIHDQDSLERIDDRLYEALSQFLLMARKIEIEQKSLGEIQARMKETLDEVWSQQAGKGLRPQALPEGLKIVEALAKSPITAEIAKRLLGA
jgi:hypothetical protein